MGESAVLLSNAVIVVALVKNCCMIVCEAIAVL